LLALLLLVGFGYRVMASPTAWGCMTAGEPASAGAEHTPDHDHGHRHHGPDRQACECVAHAPTAGLTVRSVELAQPWVGPPPAVVAHFGKTIPAAIAPAHLLPYSVGPPSLPIA
jgi:hypothetical protein